MIEIEPDSLAGPIDKQAIKELEKYRDFKFDQNYLGALPGFHGGIPVKQFFTMPSGETKRVARLLTTYNKDSTLQPPRKPSWEYPHRDFRIDISIKTLIDQEGPSCRNLFGGERIIPFAALYLRDLHSDGNSLTQGDCDLLCFDNETTPSSIVLWENKAAYEEEIDLGFDDEPDYTNFTKPVATSFFEFVKMLRVEP